MGTSIIAVIAIIVAFVVAVPAMIRRSANELSRLELDTVPTDAWVVNDEATKPCQDHTGRARVFHSDSHVGPQLPGALTVPAGTVPKLTLSTKTPEFTVIDGDGETAQGSVDRADGQNTEIAEASSTAEADVEFQRHTLPMAVGGPSATAPLDLGSEALHSASATGRRSARAEASIASTRLTAVNSTHTNPLNSARSPQSQGVGSDSGTGSTVSTRSTAGTGSGAGVGSGAGAVEQRSAAPRKGVETGDHGQTTATPHVRADEGHSMTENETRVRAAMKSLSVMIRGFALLLLGSLLGTLVTGVLAIFQIVHPALIGVFAGLMIVSLVMVRTLNLRKRDHKKRLATLHRSASTTAVAEVAPVKARQESRVTRPEPRVARRASAQSDTVKEPAAFGESKSSTKAAQARAVIKRNATAKVAREEAETGEIPIVHIRNEAAEGHTTRQVLLTGPIPIVNEETVNADAKTAEEAAVAPTAVSAPSGTAQVDAEVAADVSASAEESAVEKETQKLLAEAEAETASESDSEADSKAEADSGAASAETPSFNDPFTQRLQARDGWSPTPLPVPSYVDAPEAEHSAPRTTSADAASYEIESRSREDIAAQFAAELGYRPELSDSSREEGPLGHGRKAIRTTRAPELNVLDDVLARRRA